jgi:hypothetical protein
VARCENVSTIVAFVAQHVNAGEPLASKAVRVGAWAWNPLPANEPTAQQPAWRPPARMMNCTPKRHRLSTDYPIPPDDAGARRTGLYRTSSAHTFKTSTLPDGVRSNAVGPDRPAPFPASSPSCKDRIRLRFGLGCGSTSHTSRLALDRARDQFASMVASSYRPRVPASKRDSSRTLDVIRRMCHSSRPRSASASVGAHSLIRQPRDWLEAAPLVEAWAHARDTLGRTGSNRANHHSPPTVPVLDTHMPPAYHCCKRLHISPSHRRA